jgi:hypothetical protein
MAGHVTVDTGPITATTPYADVPKDKLRLLCMAWRRFCRIDVPYDCRELLRIRKQAIEHEAWREMGYADLDDLFHNGLEVDPEIMAWAMEGLQALDPTTPHTLDEAVKVGRSAKAATSMPDPATGEVPATMLPRGGDQRSEQARSIGNLLVDTQPARARASGISERQQRKLDALAKHGRRDLLAQIGAGEISVRGAMIEAGLEKEPDALTMLRRAWEKASPEERARFEEWKAQRSAA